MERTPEQKEALERIKKAADCDVNASLNAEESCMIAALFKDGMSSNFNYNLTHPDRKKQDEELYVQLEEGAYGAGVILTFEECLRIAILTSEHKNLDDDLSFLPPEGARIKHRDFSQWNKESDDKKTE